MNAHEDEVRAGYVDRQQAHDIQERRLRRRGAASEPPASERPERWHRRLRARVVALLRSGTTSSQATIAVVGLFLAACAGVDDAPTVASTSTPAPQASASLALSGATTCDDADGDVLALDDVALPTDGDDPNIQAADLPNVTLEAYSVGLAIHIIRDEPGAPPAGDVRHTLWMRGSDGTVGIVRAIWDASPTSDEMDVVAGSHEDDLAPVDDVRTTVVPTRTTIVVPYEALAVEPPFAWALEHAILPTGVADMCPNVDPSDPLGGPDLLPVFPEDDLFEVAAGSTIDVVAEDYEFRGVPATADAGTRLAFRNGADEPHELVLLRLSADAPPIDDFVRLPREQGEHFVVEEVATSIAIQGQPGVLRAGDLVLDEPGRYALLCPLPTGVTAQHVVDNFDGPPAGPPPSEFGPPHVVHGMYAEIEVG